MRLMTEEEQRALIKQLTHIHFGADMMTFDCICYGGDLEGYRDARDYVERAIETIPKDIRDEYDREIRKLQADKLRAQADALENRNSS